MYQSNDELPTNVRRALPPAEQSTFRDVYNATGSFEQAWNVVGKSDNVRWFNIWATIQQKDRQNEMMSVEGLTDVMPFYLGIGGPIYYEHHAAEIGTAFKGEPCIHPEKNLPAIKLTAACYIDTQLADKAWEGVKSGEFRGASIGGNALRQYWKCDDKSCFNFIEKMEWFDTSLVRRAANPGSGVIDFNMKAKSLESLSHLLDSGATGEDLVSKCPVCSRVFNELKTSMPEPDAYLHTKAIAKALTTTETMNQPQPPAGGPEQPKPEEPGLVAKADADVSDALLQKILAMFSELKNAMNNLMTAKQAPEGQAIENAVDGGENPVGEPVAEGQENVPPTDDKPSDEAPDAPADAPKEKEAEAPSEPAPEAENKPEETPNEDNMPEDEKLKSKADKTPEQTVSEITEMKQKAEIATSTPRPGMAPQPSETLFQKEFSLNDPDSLRRLGKTPMRDLIQGKLSN